MRFTLAIEAMTVWKVWLPATALVIVPSGTFPLAFSTVKMVALLVLVAITVNVCVDFDQVTPVTCSVSVGAAAGRLQPRRVVVVRRQCGARPRPYDELSGGGMPAGRGAIGGTPLFWIWLCAAIGANRTLRCPGMKVDG